MGFEGHSYGEGFAGRGGIQSIDPAAHRAGLRFVPAPEVVESACCIVLSVDRIGMIAAACGDPVAQQVRMDVRDRLYAAKDEFLDVALAGSEGDDGDLVMHLAKGSCRDLERRVGLLIDRVTRRPVITDWGDIYVTVSAGGVVSAIAKVGARWMVAWANHALADARRLGGNRVKIGGAVDHLQDWFRRAMWILGRVCDAHAAGRVALAFQPVIDRDGEVFYYECLLRAVDEFGDQLLPGEFVPVMEQMGAIGWLDRFVFERVLDELEAAPGIRLGYNISGQSISEPGWMGEALERLRGSPDLARRLIVEITETSAIADIAMVADFVAELREVGCRVAIDDFGVGFASFAHLRILGVDIVKIDQSFLEDSDGTAAWLQSVERLAGLVRKLDVQIVVEGIQSRSQLEVLDLADVTYFQGYCLGAPAAKRPWKEGGSAVPSLRVLRGTVALKTGTV